MNGIVSPWLEVALENYIASQRIDREMRQERLAKQQEQPNPYNARGGIAPQGMPAMPQQMQYNPYMQRPIAYQPYQQYQQEPDRPQHKYGGTQMGIPENMQARVIDPRNWRQR
jgi:hypothetical protein